MKYHVIYDEDNNRFISVYCDFVTLEKFEDEREFKIFVNTHPSCNYTLKKTKRDGTVEAYFNRYLHDYWSGTTITKISSFNANPLDDIELKKYYDNKNREQELKDELERIKKWNTIFEANYE